MRPRVRITDEFIEKYPRPKVGIIIERDDLRREFGVRFGRTSTAFIVEPGRTGDGKRPRLPLGGARKYPQILANEARELARGYLVEYLGVTAAGADVSLRLAMRAWYERQLQLKVWRPRYAEKVNQITSHYIEGPASPRLKLTPAAVAAIDHLGRLPVAAVKRADVMRLIHAVKPGTGSEIMAIGSSYYGTALEEGVDCQNPFRNRLKVTGGRRVRHRRLSDAEFLKLYRAIERDGDPACACFLLLALTGCRRREITQLRWSEVDLDQATITLPASRRKNGRRDPQNFVVYLHAAAVALLRKQAQLENSQFVFWSRNGKAFEFHYSLRQRLAWAGVDDWRLHDLRRYMRSGLAKLGVSQMVAEMCLGHLTARSGSLRIYDGHDYSAEMAQAWQRWGDHVTALTGLQP